MPADPVSLSGALSRLGGVGQLQDGVSMQQMTNASGIQTSLTNIGEIGEPRYADRVGEVEGGAGFRTPEVRGGAESTGFEDLLSNEIKKVNTEMVTADKMAEDLATGRSENVHATMIQLQKADVSFKMLLEVRGKLVQAYEELMRLQV